MRRLQPKGDPSGFIFNELAEILTILQSLRSHLTFIVEHFDITEVAEARKEEKEKCKQRLNRH